MSTVSSHVSKRDIMNVMQLDDDAVGELLTISRAVVNMLELLSPEPESGKLPEPVRSRRKRGSSKKKKQQQQASKVTAEERNEATEQALMLQRVHSATQVDSNTCPSLFPSLLQRIKSPFAKSDLAISRTVRSFHVEHDIADIARCVLYSGEMQRQLQAMFTLAHHSEDSSSSPHGKKHRHHQDPNNPEGETIEPLKATGVASTASPVPGSSSSSSSSSTHGEAGLVAQKVLCRRRGTTTAPSAPYPSNEIMLSVPAVRVKHNKTLCPIIATLTPTHLHVRDTIKDCVQKLPWSHLTSASLGNAPGLHAFASASSAKQQSLANITVGPRHGLLWMIARHEAQQASQPIGERKKLNLTPQQATRQAQHCVNLQFSGMSVIKDSPFPVDTSRMTPHHINELWRFELVCECEDDFALFSSFLQVIGNYHSALWAAPGMQPFTTPPVGTDKPSSVAPLKLRPTTLPEIDAAVPGGLQAWNKQFDNSNANASASSASGGGGGGSGGKAGPLPPTIAMSEAFFRMSHTDKYSRPVTLSYSSRADVVQSNLGSATAHAALLPVELDFCAEHHIGRVEYLVVKQLMLGDPLCRWVSLADVLGHMIIPLRAWNLSPAIKILKFFCDNGWLERVLVLEPGPRRRV